MSRTLKAEIIPVPPHQPPPTSSYQKCKHRRPDFWELTSSHILLTTCSNYRIHKFVLLIRSTFSLYTNHSELQFTVSKVLRKQNICHTSYPLPALWFKGWCIYCKTWDKSQEVFLLNLKLSLATGLHVTTCTLLRSFMNLNVWRHLLRQSKLVI